MEKQTEDSVIHPTRRFCVRFGIPTRYVVAFLCFACFFNTYAMRGNLSVAIMAMVDNESRVEAYQCPYTDFQCRNISAQYTLKKARSFTWDSDLQGIILGSFFYGYVITQVPGGALAERVGAKWLIGLGVLTTAILSLLTPLAAYCSASALVIVRILEGLSMGVVYPAASFLMGQWSPIMERSRLWNVAYIGNSVGTIAVMSLSGLMIESEFLGGWPAVFYVFGILGCVWFALWVFLLYETPYEHPKITIEELEYIRKDQVYRVAMDVPWKSILTSVPVWALVASNFGCTWNNMALLTEMPTYLSAVQHFDFAQSGALSSLPYVVNVTFGVISSYAADGMRKNGTYSITNIRKIMNAIALFFPALCFLAIGFLNQQPITSIFFLCLAVGFGGAANSGYSIAPIDMSPNYSGTITGISSAIANFSGIMAPGIIGLITSSGQTVENWRIVFGVCSAISFVSGVLFVLYGDAELQPWDSDYPLLTNSAQELEDEEEEASDAPFEPPLDMDRSLRFQHSLI